MENRKRIARDGQISNFHFSFSAEKCCPACGTLATRKFSRFCRVCGKSLAENYEPLDALRASYNLHGRRIEFEAEPIEKTQNLFEKNENSASTTAWAFAVYSLLPYLGILFCPFAMLVGVCGIFVARRKPYLGGGKISAASVVVGVVGLAVQIFLWWLLYVIPELSKT